VPYATSSFFMILLRFPPPFKQSCNNALQAERPNSLEIIK